MAWQLCLLNWMILRYPKRGSNTQYSFSYGFVLFGRVKWAMVRMTGNIHDLHNTHAILYASVKKKRTQVKRFDISFLFRNIQFRAMNFARFDYLSTSNTNGIKRGKKTNYKQNKNKTIKNQNTIKIFGSESFESKKRMKNDK